MSLSLQDHPESEVIKIINFAETLRKKTVIPSLQLQNFLNFQYYQLNHKNILNCCTIEKSLVSKHFKRAFRTLTRYEQACYYSKCVKLVLNEIHNTNNKKSGSDEQNEQNNGNINSGRATKKGTPPQFQKFTVLFKKQGSFKKWIISKVEVAVDLCIMRLENTGDQLDLQNYIMRISKSKDKPALVLQSMEELAEPQTLRISNYTESLDQLKNKFQAFVEKALKLKITKFLNKCKTRGSGSTDYRQTLRGSIRMPSLKEMKNIDFSSDVKQPATVQLVSGSQLKSMRKIISQKLRQSLPQQQYRKIYSKLVTRQQLFAMSSFKDYEEIQKGFFYNKKQSIAKKVFMFNESQISYQWLVTQMNCYKIFKKWKPCLFSINLLAELPKEKTKIYHQINLYKDYTQIDYVFLRHLFEIDGINYYIDKSIDTEQYGPSESRDSRGKIQYCIWRFKRIKEKIQILVELKVSEIKCKSIMQVANEFIGEVHLLKKYYQKDIRTHSSSFRTVHNANLFLFEDQSELSIAEEPQQQKEQHLVQEVLKMQNENKTQRELLIDQEINALKQKQQNKANQQQNKLIDSLIPFKLQPNQQGSKCMGQQNNQDKQYNEENNLISIGQQTLYHEPLQDLDFQRSDTQYFTVVSSDDQRQLDESLPLSKRQSLTIHQIIQIQKQVKKMQMEVEMKQISTKLEGQQSKQQKQNEDPNSDNHQSSIISVLSARHIENPNVLSQNQHHLRTSDNGHFLWGNDWKTTQKGQLINVNKQQAQRQGGVLKSVLRKMGRNLLSGKSILNISLPIQLFGTDSNLERLCKSMVYGPKFLEKAATLQDPLARMKYVICFAFGYSLCYIDMQKPFNPILGETYQGIIDGCPVYGQQISHHPPISSVLLKGRGFSAYGNFQAKVQMGMNSASGINQGFMSVSFSDKDFNSRVVKFTCPPGQISGLVYGQRKLTLIRKSYYIDEQNQLLGIIEWGSNKSKNGISHLNDYFEGKIVKLKQPLNNRNHQKLKQSDFQKTVSNIRGRWTGKVEFDNQVLFDIDSDAPFKIEEYEMPLESNCLFRQDIQLRKLQKIAQAQDAKEKLQDLQRNDKKLRKAYAKK